MRFAHVLSVVVAAAACTETRTPPQHAAPPDSSRPPGPAEAEVVADADAGAAGEADEGAEVPLEPDGNDDPEEPGAGTLPAAGRFERVGRSFASLKRVCDLTPLGGSLYAAHAYVPLGVDGATITRFTPPGSFAVAFDWNRPGEPTAGGGAGQGFVRARAIGGRLYVPDADPPYGGFGLVDHGTEGYVFASDEQGVFAKAQGPHLRPPKTTLVIPRAYHDIDVIRYHGRLYASTGAVPPGERAWRGSSPGALHAENDAGTRFDYVAGYPPDATADVWRLTYMVRFQGRVLAGIQEYYPREANDYVVFDGATLTPKRVTPHGGTQTLRWYADRGTLYWIGVDRGGQGVLRATHDGETWRDLPVPTDAGAPADIVRFRDGLVVLTEHRLLRLGAGDALTTIASWPDEGKTKGLFAVDDLYCAPPLAVFGGDLYAGSQRDGALYRLVSE